MDTTSLVSRQRIEGALEQSNKTVQESRNKERKIWRWVIRLLAAFIVLSVFYSLAATSLRESVPEVINITLLAFGVVVTYGLIGALFWWNVVRNRRRKAQQAASLLEFEVDLLKIEEEAEKKPALIARNRRTLLTRRALFLNTELQDALRGLYISLGFVIGAPFFLVGWLIIVDAREGADYGGAVLTVGLAFLVFVIWNRVRLARVRSFKQQIRANELELDLNRFGVNEIEGRAEKLFRFNQEDLDEYYKLTLNNSRTMLVLGLICIAAGLVVAGATLGLVADPSLLRRAAAPLETQPVASTDQSSDALREIMTAAIGLVSTVLTTYVATIFVKVHGRASKALNSFHERLTRTSDLFLANVIASRIEDSKVRQDTYREMCLALAGVTARPEGG